MSNADAEVSVPERDRSRAPRKLAEEIFDSGSNAFRKYQDIYVGSRSLPRLLQYEVLCALGAFLPGAAGLWVRKLLYPRLLQSCGSSCFFGPRLILRCPGRVRIGSRVILEESVVLDSKGGDSSSLEIGSDVFVSRNVTVAGHDATIRIGNHVTLGANSFLKAKGTPLIIGDYVAVGPNSSIMSGAGFETATDGPMMLSPIQGRGITIEADCWIGANSVILDGVTIGRGSVVSIGSGITRDVPAGSVVAGNPARIVQKRTTR